MHGGTVKFTGNKYLKFINWKLLNQKYQETLCKREIISLQNKMLYETSNIRKEFLKSV